MDRPWPASYRRLECQRAGRRSASWAAVSRGCSSRRRCGLPDITRLRLLHDPVTILGQKQSRLDQALDCAGYLANVCLVSWITLFDRQAAVTGGQALGPGFGEGHETARVLTQRVFSKPR